MENNVSTYGWEEGKDPESGDYIGPMILKTVKGYTGIHRICDVGCGSGQLLSTLFDEGYDVAGVEYDSDGFQIASKRVPEANIYNLGVQDDPALIMEHEQTKFDAIISTEVIEHLYSPHLLLDFSSKLLKKGGYLLITTPYHGYLKNLTLSIFDKWDSHHTPLWHGGHIKFWSKNTLSTLLNENGYDVVNFSGIGRHIYGKACSLSRN